MARNGVGNLMTHDYCQSGFCCRNRENSGIHNHFATGHTEGIFLSILYQVKLPVESFQYTALALTGIVGLNALCQFIAYPLYHLCICRASHFFVLGKEGIVLLIGQRSKGTFRYQVQRGSACSGVFKTPGYTSGNGYCHYRS
ncbi:hypothetical protein D9M68_817100 [compost metagenome]